MGLADERIRRERPAARQKKKLKMGSRLYSLCLSSTGISSRRPFVKLTYPFLVIAVFTACVTCASYASASGCPDDPERCVERGATVSHRTVAVAPATVAPTPARIAPATATAHKAPAASVMPKSKSASKPARVTPSTPAPATPGMGMLLKLSNGSGGEVSLLPSKPNDTN